MATATKATNRKQTSLTPGEILQASKEEQAKREQEASLYRDIVNRAASSEVSDDERKAAEIIAARQGWSFEGDCKALRELERVRGKFGDDIQATGEKLWLQLTGLATEMKTLKAQTDAKLHGMEITRRELELRHSDCCRSRELPDKIRAAHPHLFAK